MDAIIVEDILKGRCGKHLNREAMKIHQKFTKILESVNTSESKFVQCLKGNEVTNLERVSQVSRYLPYDDIQFNHKLAIKFRKSEEMARSLRELGNTAYKSNNLDLALCAYSKCLLFASTQNATGELALGFANRSAVLYESKKYALCLTDISRALQAGYPQQSRYKLIERAKKCMKQMKPKLTGTVDFDWNEADIYDNDIMKKWVNEDKDANKSEESQRRKKFCEQNIFRLLNPNPSIPAAENYVTIRTCDERGRHVVTTKAVSPGTVLIVDEPYAKILLEELKWDIKRCHNCHSPAPSGIPCLLCTFAFYCSESCRQSAAHGYHQYECPCTPYLHQVMFTRIFMLALRIVTTLGPTGILNLYESSQKPGHGEDILGFDNGIYKSCSYKVIHYLISHPDKCQGHELLSYTITALTLVHILDTQSTFFDLFVEERVKVKSFVASLLLLHTLNLPCNAHSLYALTVPQETTNAEECDWIRTATATEYGAGAFGLLSIINHACDPNVIRVNNSKGQVAVIALKGLSPGTELVDNYGHHYALEDLSVRRKSLLANYYFECACVPCIEYWPQLSDIRNLPLRFLCKCNNSHGHGLLEEVPGSSLLVCTKCQKEYSSKKLNDELDLEIDRFFVGHEMVLKNEPIEAMTFLIASLTYFHSQVNLPFIRMNDTEETYKQALNLIISTTE